jgi:multidrug efflux pump subunit AcrA (membrane-fusion protein)
MAVARGGSGLRRKIIIVLGMVFCLCLTSCGILPTEEEFDTAPTVKEYEGASFNKVTVARGDLVKTEEISGKYKGTVQEEIQTDGVSLVKKIYVKKGQHVKKGDKILSYVVESSENSLKEAQNKIEKIDLQIRQAKQMMALQEKKLKKTGGSKKEIASVKKQYTQQIKSYESSKKLLEMDVKIAKEEIEEEEVRASVSGTVTYVDTDAVGTYGKSDEATVKIEGATKNRFEANSEYASYCKAGETVTIDVKGQEYKAVIKKDKESTDTVYFYPTVNIDLEDGVLCSYQVVLKEKKDVLYLPSSIVYAMGDKHVVYYEDKNGLKSTKEVTIGETISNYVEITSGLEEDEQVIAN